MCAILYLACHLLCEMMRFYPMLLKLCMLKLDILIDILVLSLHFFHFWLLRYDLVNVGVTMCVTPLLAHVVDFLCHAKSTPNDLIFLWGFFWMLGLIMNVCGIFGLISDLFGISLSGLPFVDFWIVLNFHDLWNAGCVSYELEILHVVSRHFEVYCGFGLMSLSCLDSVLGLC